MVSGVSLVVGAAVMIGGPAWIGWSIGGESGAWILGGLAAAGEFVGLLCWIEL